MCSDAIEPFAIHVPDSELVDLRRRLVATRWPEPETVDDWTQGMPLAYAQRLCWAWAHQHDWRATEDRLNRIPQFVSTVDGIRVHFLHARSRDPDAIPLLLTHGWPGSFLEFEQALPLLTDPPAGSTGGRQAFDVVVPSLPGYGFTGKPRATGWDIHRIARAWTELMSRLGYSRFVAAGSDWGTSVSTSLALQHPDRLFGIFLIPPLVPPSGDATDLTDQERAALEDLDQRGRTGSGYSAMNGTRPQTIGYALLDSPVGLAAWIAEKIWDWSDHKGNLEEVLSHDQVLDNITLYWLTGSGASSARLYWESISQVTEWFTASTDDTISVPTGCAIFPKEVPRPSRRWAARRFTNIVTWSEPDRGGHFAAWEQPSLFADQLRAFGAALDTRL